MKNMFNYLWRSVVELTLLLFFISTLIRALQNDWWSISPYIIAANIFIIIYILGVAHRIGTTWAIMNEQIVDDSVRKIYGMNPYMMRDRPIRTDIIGLIFKIVFLISAIIMFLMPIIS